MPMFEFVCTKCGKFFEELVMRSDETVKCPQCNSEDVAKQISAFSSSSLTSGSSCNSGSCKTSGFG